MVQLLMHWTTTYVGCVEK